MQKLLDDNKKLRLEIRRLVQKSITTIDNKVAETEDTLKSKVDSVNVTVRETSTQLAQLEERMKGEIAKLEWYTQWYAHHTWDTKGIKVNVLSSLNSALRKANFNNEFQKLTLETLRDFLKEIPSDHDLTIHRKSWTSHLNNLENISRTISGHQEVLEQIRNSATSIKNKLTTLPEVAEQQT
jgi:predicted  nucleic acid-binding Zn-ribbon protein